MGRAKKPREKLLENVGVKIPPEMKRAIEEESALLGIQPGTYIRQLLTVGWDSRHDSPINKNPREQLVSNLLSELSIEEQDDVLAIIRTIHRRYTDRRKRLSAFTGSLAPLDMPESPEDEIAS